MNIVINGIGVAGPALAYWLMKSGHEVVLVEEAPRLRGGGYIIDFWGIGYDIAEKMGLIGAIRRLGLGDPSDFAAGLIRLCLYFGGNLARTSWTALFRSLEAASVLMAPGAVPRQINSLLSLW